MPGLSTSASIKGKQVTVTLVNLSTDRDLATRIHLDDAQAREAQGRVMSHNDVAAVNTFDNPENVVPTDWAFLVEGGGVALRLPKQSVAAVEIRIA